MPAPALAQVAHAPSVSPLMLSAIGLFVVFFALALLVFVLMGFSRLLANVPDPGHAGHAKPSPKAAAGATARDSGEGASLVTVALAAYAMHQRRRVSVRTPEPSSPWLHSGRAIQVQRFPTKR